MTSERRPKSRSSDRVKAARAPAPAVPHAAESAAPEQPAGEMNWHEQAAFHVTFDRATDAEPAVWRTKVYHNESGGEQAMPGILHHALTDWMRARAGLPAADGAVAEAPAASTPAAAPKSAPASASEQADLAIEVAELDVEELPIEQQVGGVSRGGPMRARVHFELSGPASFLATADRSGYVVQALASDLATERVVVLASAVGTLEPEHSSYAEALDFGLPPLGNYQIIANVLIPERGAVAAALGPVLEIVA